MGLYRFSRWPLLSVWVPATTFGQCHRLVCVVSKVDYHAGHAIYLHGIRQCQAPLECFIVEHASHESHPTSDRIFQVQPPCHRQLPDCLLVVSLHDTSAERSLSGSLVPDQMEMGHGGRHCLDASGTLPDSDVGLDNACIFPIPQAHGAEVGSNIFGRSHRLTAAIQ